MEISREDEPVNAGVVAQSLDDIGDLLRGRDGAAPAVPGVAEACSGR
jgi:hypothetical protein